MTPEVAALFAARSEAAAREALLRAERAVETRPARQPADAVPHPARAPVPLPPPAVAPPSLRRAQVLLVEDLAVNQMITATLLRRDGHRVDVADSGAAALDRLRRAPYDLVLMDLMMPGMSGYEAAQRIRALPGPAGQVPIVALTAHTGAADRQRCLAAGMQGMVSKPVSPADLAAALLLADPRHPRAPVAAAAIGAAPAAARPAGTDELDRARLDEIRRDLPIAVFANLSRQCLADMAVRVAALQAAFAAGGRGAIENEAHALAGMAGSYGLAAFERRMRAVMAAVRDGGTAAADAAAAAAGDLDGALARGRAALLAWLAEAGAPVPGG